MYQCCSFSYWQFYIFSSANHMIAPSHHTAVLAPFSLYISSHGPAASVGGGAKLDFIKKSLKIWKFGICEIRNIRKFWIRKFRNSKIRRSKFSDFLIQNFLRIICYLLIDMCTAKKIVYFRFYFICYLDFFFKFGNLENPKFVN